MAAIIKDAFDKNCSWYRIGGDEFCVICKDIDLDTLKMKIKKMTDSLARERMQDICFPSIAYGFSIFTGDKPLNFSKHMKEADEHMYFYKNKKDN